MTDKREDSLHSEKHPEKPMERKATQSNGSPALDKATTGPSGLRPRDDTPFTLEKKSGPKNP